MIDAAEKIYQVDEKTLGIRWKDAHESQFAARFLRIQCPCAQCVDEWTSERKVNEELVAADIHPLKLSSVGRYGVRIDWSDGHGTGIYTFKWLRENCPCNDCAEKGERCPE